MGHLLLISKQCIVLNYSVYSSCDVKNVHVFFLFSQAHGHTALHMAAGLHGSPHQEELIRLLLLKGADPSIRNLENDQPVHLLQSGEQGEKVSTACPCSYYDNYKLSVHFEKGWNV